MSSSKKAVVDIAKALRGVFKKHTVSNRRDAWEAISNSRGKKEVEKLLRNPNRNINTFKQLAFREWLEFEETLSEETDWSERLKDLKRMRGECIKCGNIVGEERLEKNDYCTDCDQGIMA
jgi:RNA polymerase-binding transcription factor DksA